MKNTKQDEFFDFIEPEDDDEIAAFRELEDKNYRKDGFENASSANLKDLEIREKIGDEEGDLKMNESELVEVDKLEKPYILLQVPHPDEKYN